MQTKQEIRDEWADVVGANPDDLDDWAVGRIHNLQVAYANRGERVEELSNLCEAKDAIIATLPKCWTIVDGVREQTRPVTIGMILYDQRDGESFKAICWDHALGYVREMAGVQWVSLQFCADSPEAAKAGAEQ